MFHIAKRPLAALCVAALTVVVACSPAGCAESSPATSSGKVQQLKSSIIEKYKDAVPAQWSETATGMKTHLDTKDKVLALTFDACGGPGKGSGYDSELIDFLIQNQIPATLFLNARWIDANLSTFKKLAANPLFEIENHGYQHKPLSVNGKSAYGEAGTQNPGEVFDEVYLNDQKIAKLTGRSPKFFRAGTAYYDEVAVKIVNDLGMQAVGFSVLGDAGTTYTADEIVASCLKAKAGDILIFHLNHPEKETNEGVRRVIPKLLKKGFTFVRLGDYNLR